MNNGMTTNTTGKVRRTCHWSAFA